MILFENVTKSYDGISKAVDNVSFHVPEGKLVVLLGPSGCGKTTLLRMVNRLVPITSGKIFIDQQDINTLDKIKLRRNIGYVIQSNGLFPNMTIEENVVAVPDLLGWSKKQKRDRYYELMQLIGLDPDEYRKRYPHELSGGQQQRIGIARALASDPPVMLMDEPFGALDPIIRNHLQNEFLRILKTVKKTVLFVSHDIDEAIKMGDKIAIFKDGKLMQYDEPSKILTNPNSEFISQFVGQDRALKRLSLHSIKELITLGLFDTTDLRRESEVESISLDCNLRDAVSMIFNQNEEQLIVKDDTEKRVGIVKLDHIAKFLHLEAKNLRKLEEQGVK